MFENVKVGDKIRFMPQSGNRWWNVTARDSRYVVAMHQAYFQPHSEYWYTVVDLSGWTSTYNGVPPGVVRSSLNTLGGGFDIGEFGENSHEILNLLHTGQNQISVRRVVSVNGIEIKEQ